MAGREAAPNNVGTRTQQRPDPRLVLLAAVAVTAVCIIALVRMRGFDEAFRLWNIPGYGTPFLDWRMIPGSASSYSQGFDPAVVNPGDPIHRPFNYPKIWYVFFQAPFPPESDIPAGIAIFGCFWLSVVFFHAGQRGSRNC